MANKLYSTVANLYNEIKSARKNKPSLGDAIDDSIKNQEEVLNAREGFPNLKTRLDNIEEKLSNTDVKYELIKSDFYNLDLTPPKAEVPVVSLDGKDFLVSLENKISYREDYLTIPPGEQRVLATSGDNNMYDSYLRTNNVATALKTYNFNTESDVKFDASINDLGDKSIVAEPTGELYKLPFNLSKMFYMDQLDAVMLPNMCSVSSDYSTPTTNADGTVNYSNHLINALRGGSDWVVNRSFLTVMVVFDRVTSIKRLVNRHKSDSSICNLIIEVSTNGSTWTKVYGGNENDLDFTLTNVTDVKYIRYTYNCYDNAKATYKLTLSEISIYCPAYNTVSGVVETIQPIPMYEHDVNLKVVTTGATDEVPHMITKFAITNTTDNGDKWSTYIPKLYTALPCDFYDEDGMRYTGSALKSTFKVDTVSTVALETKSATAYGLTSAATPIGSISLTAGNDYSVANAWKINEASYFRAFVRINGLDSVIPIAAVNIGKDVKATIGGYSIVYTLSVLNNNTIKMFIRSDNVNEIIKIEEVRVELVAADWFGTRFNWGGFVNTPMFNSSELGIARAVQPMKGLDFEAYSITGQYYTYLTDWFFGGNYMQENIPIAGYVSIIPKKFKTGKMSWSYASAQEIATERNANIMTVRMVNCELPLNVYMCTADSATLFNTISTDVTDVMRIDNTPVFNYKREFKTRVFVGKAGRVSKIIANENSIASDLIGYAVSFDDLNYYIFDKDKLEWKTNLNNNTMSDIVLSYPNETFYNKIKTSEWLYIKVVLKSPDASLNNIQVQFTNDMFVLIDKEDILEKGMFKRHLEAIEPQSLTNFLRDDYSIIKLASIAMSMNPAYRYSLSGYQIQNYNEVQWERIDLTKVKEYLLPKNGLVYKNISTATQYVKVVRRIIENQVAVIDAKDEDKLKIQEISDKEDLLQSSIEVLKQNVEVLHQSMLAGSVPTTLPDVLLPSVKEIDVPALQEGEFYKISDVPELRGIQVWEEQSAFKQYDQELIFDPEHASQYTSVGVTIKSSGAEVNTDYDRDNPYYMSEAGTLINSTKAVYPNYDLTVSLAPATNSNILNVIDNGGDAWWASATPFWATDEFGYTFSWRTTKYSRLWGYNVFWDLPGENIRWVDMIFDFRQNVWLNYLADTDFAVQGANNGNWSYFNYQITTFAVSLDGKEYVDVKKFTGAATDQTITFEREIRYLRIRLEVPYTTNRGAGRVSFTEMDIYVSPLRYNHTGEFYLYNTDPIDTSKWLNFDQIKVDRFIDHNPAEMKFLLSDDPNRNTWKAWNGTKWVETTLISLSTAMSIETLLALTKDQLNLLNKGSLYVAAIMKTTDGHKTPVLRKIEFLHDLDTEKYYQMVDLNTIDFKYSKTKEEIIVTNDTDGEKKLKIVLL